MRKIFILSFLLILIAALVGCEKFTAGYDTNPLRPSDADALSTFVGAELGYTLFTEGFPSQLASIWAQQITGVDRQFTGYQGYTGTTSYDLANDWSTAYSGALANLKVVETKAAAAGTANLKGVAEVLEGIHMGTLAALWGDVPYSEACNPAITAPHYDGQLAVYTAVQAVLSQGITDLTGAGNIAKDMSSYAGDVSKWRKAGYTAKARYLMHVARHNAYASADLNAVIAAATNGVLSTTGSEDLMLTHGTVQGGNMNNWYAFFAVDRTGYMDASGTFVVPMLKARKLDGKSDEAGRLAKYFDGTNLNTSTGVYQPDSPYPIIRAAETHLLLAEANARLGANATAITELNNARHYANSVFGNTSKDFVAADPAVATNAALLQTILNEEYVALMHQLEAFNFVRRVGYAITYSDTAGTGVMHAVTMAPTHGTSFPQRFYYSSDEINANVNTPAQSTNDLYVKTPANLP